jgi:hypothetical protein
MANDGDDDSAAPVGGANSDPHTSEVKSAEEPDSESSSDLEAQISSPSPQLSFDLASNAYDFLNESLNNAQRASTGEPVIWKFAIANIAQAIELLLKERLRREDFLLVYADIDRKRRTVNVDQALDRLSNYNVILDKEDVVRLKRARDVRNEIVHFTIIVNEEQLRANLYRSIRVCSHLSCQRSG